MTRALFLVLLALAPMAASAQVFYHRIAFEHATDCTTGITNGKNRQLCVDLDDGALWRCEPSAGDCDTAGEWKAVGSVGAEVNDLSAVVTWANVPDANVSGASERDEVCGTTDLSSSCEINSNVILEADLNEASGTPADGDLLTYNLAGTNFNWVTPNAGTDVTADLEEETHASEHANGGGDAVDHDTLTNFVSDEHVAHSGVDLTAGAGLSGGGTIDVSRSFAVDSQEAGFLADGGAVSLTCGGGTAGQAQVMDDGDLEWCDGAATPGLQSVDAKIAAQDHTDHGDGANCAAGEIPLGVDADGAVQGCYEPTEADISDLAHTATAITDGLVDQPDIDDTDTVAANPDNGANAVWFGTTGLIFEGATNDLIEGLLTAADPTTTDKTWTLPDETGTVCTTGSVCTGYEPSGTYSGVGTCTAQFVRALNDGAGPTCESIVDADVPDSITIDNATTAANLGADGVDAMAEIAAGIKRGPDATDTHLLTTDVSAPGSATCLEMDTDGSIVLAGGSCASLGPGGTTTIDALGDAAGVGAVQVGSDQEYGQTWTWNTPATTVGALDALSLVMDLDATSDAQTQHVLVVERSDGAGTTALEALVQINNNEVDAAVTDAIEITAAAGTITNALDLNDAQITNFAVTPNATLAMAELELLDGGTRTDEALCTYETTGNQIECDVNSEALLETALGGADVIVVATDDVTSANLATAVSDETGTGVVVFGTDPILNTPNIRGVYDLTGTAVDDDDCTGQQGSGWWDSVDLAWEFCNANSGAPATLSASAGDIEAVGDCTSGSCFVDGTNNGASLVYEGATIDGNQTTLTFSGDPGGAFTVTIPNETGTVVTTASDDDVPEAADYSNLTGGAGIVNSPTGTIATASSEADFLASGALTCGASTQGKMQVHTTPLQYCDNAATPTLQYAAYGDSSGNASVALDLQAGSEVVADAEVVDTITINHSSTGTLTLDADDPTTNEGRLAWNSTSNVLMIGEAGGTDYAAAGASDGDALAGDTATAFFDAGQIEAARGGTGLDTSGSSGVARVSTGTWSTDATLAHLGASTGQIDDDDLANDAVDGGSGGEIQDNTIDQNDLAATITFATADNIVLPIEDGDQTTDGEIDYDTTNEVLEVGDDGVATLHFVPAEGISSDIAMTAAGVVTIQDNAVQSDDIDTEVRSMYWPAAAMSTDGTECSAPSEVTINSGPKQYVVACPMGTSETDGFVYGQGVVLPDGFDQTADVIFELTAYIVTDSGAGTWHGVVDIQCQSQGEIIDSTWGTGIGLDLTPVAGDAASDVVQDESTAVDTDTTGEDCDAGDILFWRWKSCDTDATPSTGCTSSAGFENDLNILGMKMEYTTNVGD